MPTKTEENMHFCLIGPDGEVHLFNGLIGVSSLPEATYDGPYSAEHLKDVVEAEFTFEAKSRNQRGFYDVLIGRTWTKAAQRYIRWSKRQKEKLRRQKLKECCG